MAMPESGPPLAITIVGPCAPREFAIDLGIAPEAIPVGLVGTPITALVRALLDAGHRVNLVTASPDVAETQRFSSETLQMAVVRYRPRPRDRALDLFRAERVAMRNEIIAFSGDIVHAHWTYEFAWAALAQDRAPVLVTAHDAPFTVVRHAPSVYRLLRLAMALWVRPRIKHLTAVSPYLAGKWRRQLGYRRPVAVIPNISPFEPQLAERAPQTRVVEIADDSSLKNVRGLLAAFSLVRRVVPEATLELIGVGLGSGGRVAAWARAKNLDSGVDFIGPAARTAVRESLIRSRLLAHASLEESQGMVLLEAMALGRTVVAGADSGGVAWTLGDGAAGVLVNVRSPIALAAAIVEVLTNPTAFEDRIAAARQLIELRYSPRAVVGAYLVEYRRIVEISP